jgi:LPS sulfotransferase NodH
MEEKWVKWIQMTSFLHEREKMQPHISYLICATPRSGSFLLCEALKNTGLAGQPEEYFWRGDEPFWKERWSVSSYADYVAGAISQGTTLNGVFGAKIMWGYFDDFVGKLRSIAGYEDQPIAELLSTIFPNLHYIWITRRDKVRQAISHEKAIQTNIWAMTDETPPFTGELHFDFARIDAQVHLIESHEAAWQQYFAENGITPFTVIYEELVVAYEQTATQILHELSIPVPEALQFAPRRMRRQTDTLSEEWAQRYHVLKRASGSSSDLA